MACLPSIPNYDNATAEIFSAEGKLVKSIALVSGENRFKESRISSGTFILRTKVGGRMSELRFTVP